jgi:hypothetical protein
MHGFFPVNAPPWPGVLFPIYSMAGGRAEHAVGSLEKPLGDAALEAKFSDLADGVLPKAQAQALMEKCWKIANAPDAGAIARAAAV